MNNQSFIPGDTHPPGYQPKLRRRLWYDGDRLVKMQWQRNCFSNPDGKPGGGWKAVDTVIESDVVDILIEERGFTHDENDDVVESKTGYQG